MIKAEELRIGNLVTVDEYRTDDFDHLLAEELTIVTLKGDKAILQRSCGCCHEEVELSHLAGIPLTEEWLNEAGISEQMHGEQWGQSDQRITGFQLSKFFFLQKCLCRDASGRYDGFSLVSKTGLVFRTILGCQTIKTVHRLQNIVYDLTGEELKINKA
jgi:hypothetical protein